MATETEQLVYELQATFDKFAASFESATKSAQDNFQKMDSAGKESGDRMAESMKAAVKSVADSFSSLEAPAKMSGDTIGALLGGGIIAGVIGVASKMDELINTLASAGDRADSLRIPINILQALAVAADQARVPTTLLNSALDQFSKVSKQSAEDADQFYKALNNIGPAWAKSFASAPTQTNRLLVLMNALKSTTDETKQANLGLSAFGTDNERLVGIFSAGAGAMEDYISEVRKLGLEIDESAVKKAQEAKSALSLLARVMTDELSSSLAELIPSFKELLPLLEKVAGYVRDTVSGFASPENRPLATLKNDARDAAVRIVELEDQLKQLDAFKPVGGLIGKGASLLGTDVATSTNDKGDHVGIAIGLESTKKGITDQIVETKAALAKYQELINQKQKMEDDAKGHDGAEAPAFKPRPSLKKDTDDSASSFDRQVTSLNRHAAALDADGAAIGKTASEAQTLKAELALLQAAQRDGDGVTNEQIDAYTKLRATMSSQQAMAASGIKLNDANAASFDQATTRIKTAATNLDEAKRHFEGVNSALKFAGDQLMEIFDKVGQKGQTWQQTMTSVLQAVEKQMMQAALTGGGAFGQLFGTASTTGGVGGLLGGLAKMLGVAGARAEGGDVRANTPYLIGERGPEIMIPRGAGSVIPNSKIALGAGTRNQVVHNSVANVTVNAGAGGNGASNQDLAQRVGRAVQDQMSVMVLKAITQQKKPGGVLYG
jgi:hypothetical protein